MHNSIWKFPLPSDLDQGIPMPVGSEILSAQIQDDQICIWAKVNVGAPTGLHRIAAVGTGWNSIDPVMKFIATVRRNLIPAHPALE